MTDVADLLMPKLGLTMTEGTVARWLVEPGVRFAQGDVVVVIETDKIANEVEAPAEGELTELVSPEGAVVPVGAVIARWRLDGVSIHQTKLIADVASPSAVRAGVPIAATVPDLNVARDGTRIIATPYARRLAQEEALDLSTVSGSGPRGRIKAADVVQALESRVSSRIEQAPLVPAGVTSIVRRGEHSLVTLDIDVGALRAVDERLAQGRTRVFERRDYVALACVKAVDGAASPLRVGVDVGSAGFVTIEGRANDTLSAISARFAHKDAMADAGGDIAIFIAEGRAGLFAPALPDGWRMALGIGGLRPVRGGGDTTHEMTLALSYDADAIDHAAAGHALDRIAALLEEPLHLLAG